MKSYTLVVLAVACLVLETTARPEKTMQEKAQDLLGNVKSGVEDAAGKISDAASKAADTTKTTAQDAVQSAQQISKQGVETGREWVDDSKSAVGSYSKQAVDKVADKLKE